MAAGRVDVSRRRVYNGYSDKYFDRCRKEANGVELNRIDQHDGLYKNGYHVSSSTWNSHFQRSVHSCRDEERKLGELQTGNTLYFCPRLEDGEIPNCEDEIPLPPEKKRKLSPIIWDREEKLPLKNRVLLATAIQSLPPPRASFRGLDCAPDAGVAKYTFPLNQVKGLELLSHKSCVRGDLIDSVGCESKSPANLSPSLSLEKRGIDDLEKRLGEEKRFAEARNISMSRWASDSDSPRNAYLSEDEDVPGDRSRLSRSIERDRSVEPSSGVEDSGIELKNDDIMDADRILDKDDDVVQMDESCDQVEEPISDSKGSVNMLQGCRSVYEYEKLHEISEGTYGKVYKAKDKKSGEIVALKKVKMDVGGDRNLEEYGFPLTSLREINILLSLRHPSIVNVKEVVMGGSDNVFMVMEYMEHDLKGLMQVMKQPFSTSEVKCLMLQLLGGVNYLHDNWVLHRDLKTSNLLLNNEGDLKICDFGMSRLYGSPLKPYTSLVVTLWYRAPELLLGAKQYSTAVDMWSVGCIMAELLAKESLFKGKNEIDQLTKIFRILGTPNETIWPRFSKLPGAKANFVNQPYNLLRKKFPATSFTGSSVLSDLGFDLLKRLLTYDPEKRLTADAALNHPWFHEVPLPKSKAFMPTFPPQYARNR